MNMVMDDLQVTKRSRIGCSYEASSEVKHKENNNYNQKGVRAVGVNRKPSDGERMANTAGVTTTNNRLATANWHQHSSRICRVSRASGGKDRHSKVLTVKGLRDRRVRLSVPTAIQFYDLQDRLGVDQPSKAVEWLIKAASAAISELPELDGLFPEHSDELMIADEKHKEELKGQEDDTEDDDDKNGDMDQQHQQRHLSLTKSACSSTSENSKGSVLSLSHPITHVKVKERAKERTSKDKERKVSDGDEMHPSPGSHYCNLDLHYHHNPISQESFTELLTGHGSVTLAHAHLGEGAGSFHKQIQHLPVALTADYFSQTGPFGQGHRSNPPSGLPVQTHFGLSSAIEIMPLSAATTDASPGEHADTQQQFFLQDHLIPVAAVAATTGGEYNLNFSIPSGLYGFHRGTLQSNSQSIMPNHHHLQRISSPADGSNLSFFLSASTPSAPTSGDNPFPASYNSHLQLCSGDGYRKTDLKGKGKGKGKG